MFKNAFEQILMVSYVPPSPPPPLRVSWIAPEVDFPHLVGLLQRSGESS